MIFLGRNATESTKQYKEPHQGINIINPQQSTLKGDEMEQSSELKKDIDSFQLAVRKLSDAVNKCEIEWNDTQFQKLSGAIKSLASSSKQLIASASECELAIKRFQQTESEQ